MDCSTAVPAVLEGDEAVVAGAPSTTSAVPLGAFSNENLLKMDCHDGFSMVSAIKKKITQHVPKPSEDAPLLPGLVRIGKAPRSSFVFMSFATEADREAAAEKLQQIVHRGKKWVRVPVTDFDLNVTHGGGSVQKRKRDGAGEQQQQQQQGHDHGASGRGGKKGENSSSVAPWSHLPYDEQIRKKTAHCEAILDSICGNQKVHKKDFSYLKFFDGVHRSEATAQYRNHVNFSCGYDAFGEPVIGFNDGALVDGVVSVMPASSDAILATTHKIAQFYANAIQGFAGARFPLLKMMDKRRADGAGFWRRVQVRHSVDAEVMIDLEIDVKSVSEAVLRDVLGALVADIASEECNTAARAVVGDGRPWRLVSLQYHSGHGTSQQADGPRVVVFGAATLCETVCGRRFDLSPTAFFQVNTRGMERMMDLVAACANLTPNTILLDLCCGTGTIGLCLADRVKKIIGIEMVADAIENAKVNAAANGVTNVEYHAAKLEDVLTDVLRRLADTHVGPDPLHVVGILDPPRSGLHPSVVRTLRTIGFIEELVYISCDQRALVTDADGFTKDETNKFRGEKFNVVKAFGVDLFPHTHHVEMVAVFKRGKALAEHKERDRVAAAAAATAVAADVEQ